LSARKPLKILIALQYYLPHRTGVPLHIQRVAEKLVQRGHEVTVIAARHTIDLPRDETINGVRIVRLWAAIQVSRGMVMPAYPWALYLFLGVKKYDVVWVSTPMLETALSAIIAQITRRGLVCTHHGDLILPKGLFNRFVSWFTFLNYKYMARFASKLITYSSDYAQQSYYLIPYMEKVRAIFPPIQIPKPDSERAADLHERWSQEGDPVIGYAGRFVLEKRPDLAIRALEVIHQKYPKARLVFAGNHKIPYENTWEKFQPLVQRFNEHLIFLGEIASPEALANYYAACDVLVLPSDTECFALVQVEAMLCGTPVVATDIPGARVPVRETGMGKLAPAGDAEAIGRALLDVLDHPEKYVKTEAEVRAVFDLDRTVDQYEEEFYRAAERGKR